MGKYFKCCTRYFNFTKLLVMWGPVGIVISVFVLCVNFIGDGLRDSTDPSQQG